MGDMGWLNWLSSLETRLDSQEHAKRMDMMDMMVGKGHVNIGRKVCHMKSVYLESDMAGKLAACGGIHLGDQRWIHRRHGVYQEGVGEDRMVCPYSQQVRDLELSRLFQRYLMTNIIFILSKYLSHPLRCRQHSLLTLHPSQLFLA